MEELNTMPFLEKEKIPVTYLGDGLYARFDGYGFWITSENGVSVLNEIYIEPEVWDNLIAFRKEVYSKFGRTC